jgi:hypothetical protein
VGLFWDSTFGDSSVAPGIHQGDIFSSIRIWGYRNIWYRYKPTESDLVIPASLNALSLMHTSFMNCFGSQSAASFPSYEHDGPFSELAQRTQVEQYSMVKNCLGKDYFHRHSHPRLRGARGLIFVKEISLPEFYEKVRELKKLTREKDNKNASQKCAFGHPKLDSGSIPNHIEDAEPSSA